MERNDSSSGKNSHPSAQAVSSQKALPGRCREHAHPSSPRAMAKPTPLKDALKALEAKEEMPKEEMEVVKLYGFMPPIAKLDASLSTLKKCKKLSLSTNTIDKITSVSGMDR